MRITDILCFLLPIGWDELGAIATAVAVIVALYANKKATQQLKSALKMQEQSKNVGLLDRRIELAEKIQSGKTVSELTLQVLFNDEIFEHYKAWQTHLAEKSYAEHDLDTFFLSVKVKDGEGGYIDSVRAVIRRYETDMNKHDCPQQVYDEYEDFCNNNVVWLRTGENSELEPYNHSEINGRIAKAKIEAEQEQDLTLKLIEMFIADSISSIGTKTKSKKGEG